MEFRNGKSLKDYIMRPALPEIGNFEGSEPRGKSNVKYVIMLSMSQKHVGKSGSLT